ncbi:hypothetical protein [Levilactobacillus phage ENFP1]|nr:hypothetical protein [Levilactobacillus phage ENFP1]
MKVNNNTKFGHNPLEYHVGDIIESIGIENYTHAEYITHYLVCQFGHKYGLLYIEGNEIETYDNKPFLKGSLKELYETANDPDDILVDAELVIK